MKVNILVGRFQPLTLGHFKCVEKAMKTKKVPTLLCMIDTPSSKVDVKHPFTTDIMFEYIKESGWRDADILKYPLIIKNADIVKIKDSLREYSKQYLNDEVVEIISWTCGTDRYPSYDKMCKKYAPEIEIIEIKRGDKDISATKAREALRNNDKNAWDEIVPEHLRSNEWFNRLKEAISDVRESMYGLSEFLLESFKKRSIFF